MFKVNTKNNRISIYISRVDIIRTNILACLLSVHNAISLSRHKKVCLTKLRFDTSTIIVNIMFCIFKGKLMVKKKLIN